MYAIKHAGGYLIPKAFPTIEDAILEARAAMGGRRSIEVVEVLPGGADSWPAVWRARRRHTDGRIRVDQHNG